MSEKYNQLLKILEQKKELLETSKNLPEKTRLAWSQELIKLATQAGDERLSELEFANEYLQQELFRARSEATFWFEQLNQLLIRQQRDAEHRQKLDKIIAHSKNKNLNRDIKLLFAEEAEKKREPFSDELLKILESYAKPVARAVVKNVIECRSKSKTRPAYKSTDKSVSKKGARSRSVAGAKNATEIFKQAGVKKI